MGTFDFGENIKSSVYMLIWISMCRILISRCGTGLFGRSYVRSIVTQICPIGKLGAAIEAVGSIIRFIEGGE